MFLTYFLHKYALKLKKFTKRNRLISTRFIAGASMRILNTIPLEMKKILSKAKRGYRLSVSSFLGAIIPKTGSVFPLHSKAAPDQANN